MNRPNAFFHWKPAPGLMELNVPWHVEPIFVTPSLYDAVKRLMREGHEDSAKRLLGWFQTP